MEGGIDPSHVSFLHSKDMHSDPLHRNTKGAHYQSDQKPKFEIVSIATQRALFTLAIISRSSLS
jgi:hypothetical protein